MLFIFAGEMNHLLCGDEMRVVVKVSQGRKWSGSITGEGYGA
jgi:NifU-like protein involved in Fe-S cluster formation